MTTEKMEVGKMSPFMQTAVWSNYYFGAYFEALKIK